MKNPPIINLQEMWQVLQLAPDWAWVLPRFFFSSDGVLGHHRVTWWSFSVPFHCCLWLAQLGIFKLNDPSLISSTKLDCLFLMNKQTLLSCLDWYCEAALIQSVLWKALYKYIWLDLTPATWGLDLGPTAPAYGLTRGLRISSRYLMADRLPLASTWRAVRPPKEMPPHTIIDPPPNWSCWRMLQAAKRSPRRLQTVCHMCSVWICFHLWRVVLRLKG